MFNPANKFTYHMQELAFFSWFYGAPFVGVNGWFSNNDTFTHDAELVCQWEGTPTAGSLRQIEAACWKNVVACAFG
jgi:hypothetical protein